MRCFAEFNLERSEGLEHDIFCLSLLQHPFRIYGIDQMRVDQFYRQQFTYQELFDEAATLYTVY